ncbi:hypothetical protein K469DRAFT_204983 [Zopfia rhizophila CBS 207.26]|uniref:Uncharacterized protein n=1 Tax=Zopfia rhizophila CBS 207.26 TaxID=1314779 RepID=A0A6A6DYZ8_9PEZI|nr:hypothetical protein K469DRAFT_204983 [Zopfia rhizophila CBS 207.26]
MRLRLPPSRVQVRLQRLNKLCPEYNLVSHPKCHKQDQTRIRYEEIRCVPRNKHREAGRASIRLGNVIARSYIFLSTILHNLPICGAER